MNISTGSALKHSDVKFGWIQVASATF